MSLNEKFVHGATLYTQGRDYNGAFRAFLDGFNDKCAACALGLARMYLTGRGAREDKKKGEKLLAIATRWDVVSLLKSWKTTPEAQFYLGFLYAKGACGLFQSLEEAKKCYVSAAEDGHVGSMYNLGNWHMGHGGEEVDVEKGLELFMKAAALGDYDALFNMGVHFHDGIIGKLASNLHKSEEFYLRAIAAGSVEALHNIGIIYRDGQRDHDRDTAVALRYFVRAHEGGHCDGSASLASCHKNATFLARNYVSAAYYMTIASMRGNAWSTRQLKTHPQVKLYSAMVMARIEREIAQGLHASMFEADSWDVDESLFS